MKTAGAVAQLLLGLAILGTAYFLLCRISARYFRRHRIPLAPWLISLVTIVCALMLMSLAFGAVRLADQPAAYDVGGAVLVLGLVVVDRSQRSRYGRRGDEPRLAAAVRSRPGAVVAIGLAVLISMVALVVSYRSDQVRSRPVTALSAAPTAEGIEILVVRGDGDDRPLQLRIVSGSREIWNAAVPSTVGTTRMLASAPGLGSADPPATVQLLADAAVIRSVSAR
jgi:hypothetical protein